MKTAKSLKANQWAAAGGAHLSQVDAGLIVKTLKGKIQQLTNAELIRCCEYLASKQTEDERIVRDAIYNNFAGFARSTARVGELVADKHLDECGRKEATRVVGYHIPQLITCLGLFGGWDAAKDATLAAGVKLTLRKPSRALGVAKGAKVAKCASV